jgi:uncharacterized membrane protein
LTDTWSVARAASRFLGARPDRVADNYGTPVYEWALLLHLLGVIAYFAGLAVAAAGLLAARRRTTPAEIAALLGAARWGVALVGAGLLATIAGGLWLLAETIYGREGWVIASLVLLLVAVVTGGVGGQTPKRARRLSERLAREAADVTPELRAELGDRRADALNAFAAAASVAIVVLMVFKP